MKLTALLIVEDLKVHSFLVAALQQNFKSITIIEKYFENNQIVEKVNKYSPDIVFCELDMLTPNPFDLISSLSLDHANFIFIASKDNPLLKALQFGSLNYLIKNFSSKELKEVMHKVCKHIKKTNKKDLQPIVDGKISLATHNAYHLVDLSDIGYIVSSGNYCTVALVKGEKITLTKLIGEFEKILPVDRFFRIHQSYIVNLKFIAQVIHEDGLEIILRSGFKIPVARRRKKDLLQVLGINNN